MRKLSVIAFTFALLLVTARPVGAGDIDFYGPSKWPWPTYQSVPYAIGNISYFNGAGQANAVVRFGPNTVNAVPGNAMQMWYAGADSSSYPGSACAKTNIWFYQKDFATLPGASTTWLGATARCPAIGTVQAASVMFNTNPGVAWYIRLDGYIWDPWRYDLAATSAHETVHAQGWTGHFVSADEGCPWNTMCEVMLGGTTIMRTFETHDNTNINLAY